MNKLTTSILCLIAWLAFIGPTWAQSDVPSIPWSDLSSSEQRILSPLKDSWSQLPAERQHRMQKGARRWTNMNPEQRQFAQQRLKRWKQLDPQQKERIRQRFNRFKQLPKERRQALRQNRKWFKGLPAERRKELREKWRNLPQEKRRQIQRDLGIGRPHRPKALSPRRAPRDLGVRPMKPIPKDTPRPRRPAPLLRDR